MAVAPLNLLAEHQAWFSNGLGFLLLDEPVQQLVAACNRLASGSPDAGKPPGQSAGGLAAAERPSFASSRAQNLAVAGSGSRSAAPTRYAENQSAGASRPDFAVQAGFVSGQGASRRQEGAQAAPPRPKYDFDAASLPAAWQSILQKVNPGPVVWIYPELGQDLRGLSGAEGAARSAALRSIIGSLKLKRGTNSFWPVSAEGFEVSPAGRPERALFHGGLEHLGAKYLIVFGPSALRGTDFESLQLRPFSEQVCQGRMIIALPDFSELAADSAGLQSVSVFLHSIFSRVFMS